jgi:2-keto-4-pentenoate hydratase/2-oxohepta-3-ene-1,7-dioic acid hydratase in catechol pathway
VGGSASGRLASSMVATGCRADRRRTIDRTFLSPERDSRWVPPRPHTQEPPAFERSRQLRFVSYRTSGLDGYRAGLLVGDTVVDAAACAAGSLDTSDVNWQSVKSIIADASSDQLRALDAASRSGGKIGAIRRSELMLGPPIPDPNKILCIGLNYRDHVEEAQRERPELGTQPDPVVFSKFTTALIGDGDAVVLPDAAPSMIDWEGELAAVIGRTARRVDQQAALDFVAGYTIFNDVSARDVQLGSPQWLMGKSFDTSGPCGPALVTPDEVGDPQSLTLETRVNEEVVQSTTTSQMINPVARLIAYISSLITLAPGDIIATGTPSGVGFSREPQVFLQANDRVSVTISGLGTLTNAVRAES